MFSGHFLESLSEPSAGTMMDTLTGSFFPLLNTFWLPVVPLSTLSSHSLQSSYLRDPQMTPLLKSEQTAFPFSNDKAHHQEQTSGSNSVLVKLCRVWLTGHTT